MPPRCVWRRDVFGHHAQRHGIVLGTLIGTVVRVFALSSPLRSGSFNGTTAPVGVHVHQASVASGHRPTGDYHYMPQTRRRSWCQATSVLRYPRASGLLHADAHGGLHVLRRETVLLYSSRCHGGDGQTSEAFLHPRHCVWRRKIDVACRFASVRT